MGTVKPQLKTYIESEYYEKFKIIANSEHRTISNYLQKLVIDEIDNYEKQNGKVNIKIGNVVGQNNGTINM